MKKIKATMIFLTLIMALVVMPSAVFAEVDCTNVGTEEDLRACLEAGESVTLTSDITLTGKSTTTPTTNKTVGIYISGDDKTITINGQDHYIKTTNRVLFEVKTNSNIEVKFVNVELEVNAKDARVIDMRSGGVKLSLDDTTVTAKGAGNVMGINVGGASGPFDIDITNGSHIDAGTSGYGIQSFNPIVLNVEGSTIEGFAAIYLRAADASEGTEGSVLNVNDSILIGKSVHSGETNAFGTIVFEDDGVEVSIVDSEIIATNTGDQQQVPFVKSSLLTNVEKDIDIVVSGDSVITVDTVYEESLTSNPVDKFNVTVTSGVEANIEIEEKYLEEGSKTVETENGVVVSKEHTITVLTYENGTITVDKTKAYLNDIITVTVTPKDGYKVKLLGAETIAGGKITLTDGKFTMPNEDVVVGAEFEKVAAPVVPVEPPVDNPETSDINLVAVMSMLTLGLVGLGYTVKKRFN